MNSRFYCEADRALLVKDGLDHLDVLFERFLPEETRHPGRHVSPTTLSDGTKVFIKLQYGRQRLIPTMRELRDRRVYRSTPENEWNGLNLLRSAGLEAAEPMAIFREGGMFFRAAIIIRAVPVEVPIHTYFEDRIWETLTEKDREALREEMLHVIDTIHAAGLGWAGIAAKHLYPAQRADGTWFYWLIDCEGVHGSITEKTRSRDMAKLRRSLERCHADRETIANLSEPLSK